MSGTTEGHRGNGSVEAGISTAIVRLLREYTGRGPTKARTTYADNLVVCVLADALTTGERALLEGGKVELVLETRRAFQDTMSKAIVGEVERLTGREAFAFLSANHVNPDIGVEVVLLKPLDGEPGIAAA
jgi:uncharacterized protein YbcI